AAASCTCWASATLISPAIAKAAIWASSVLRLVPAPWPLATSLDISLPHFFRQIFRSAPRQGADGEGRILIRIADERRGVGHGPVLHVVRLAIFIQRRRLGIVAHTDGADFVNDLAPGRDFL